MKKLTAHLSVLGLLLLSACEFNSLPSATKKGANTMGCLINGKEWIAKTSLFAPGKPRGGYNPSSRVFGIYGHNAENNLIHVHIQVNNVQGEGKYSFSNNPLSSAQIYTYGSWASCEIRIEGRTSHYYTDARYPSRITFTRFDVVGRIYSGKFEFTAVNRDDSTDVIRVTKGRFDLGPQ
ncbi:MAG: hypothetical protein ICV83_18285 [Cytophagales bacterium]|nr:hypothetical protein [Cytophagales bacterium]